MGPLTKRETQIVRHVRLGYSNKDIAQHLGITRGTVKTHLRSVYLKLNIDWGASRRAQLATWYVEKNRQRQ